MSPTESQASHELPTPAHFTESPQKGSQEAIDEVSKEPQPESWVSTWPLSEEPHDSLRKQEIFTHVSQRHASSPYRNGWIGLGGYVWKGLGYCVWKVLGFFGILG